MGTRASCGFLGTGLDQNGFSIPGVFAQVVNAHLFDLDVMRVKGIVLQVGKAYFGWIQDAGLDLFGMTQRPGRKKCDQGRSLHDHYALLLEGPVGFTQGPL